MLHGKEEGINVVLPPLAVDLVGDHAERFNGGLPVRALVGPIIESHEHSAVVLLEVDGQAVISCILVDVLSGEGHELSTTMPARRPNAFSLSHAATGTKVRCLLSGH